MGVLSPPHLLIPSSPLSVALPDAAVERANSGDTAPQGNFGPVIAKIQELFARVHSLVYLHCSGK